MARKFLGSANEYITIPSVPDAPLAIKLTFGCWFRKDVGATVSEYHTLFSKGKSGDSSDRHLWIDHRLRSSVEHLEVVWTQPYATSIEYYSPVALAVGRWYHLLLTCNWTTNPDTIALYLNGIPLALTNSGGTNAAPTTGATQVTSLGNIPTAAADRRFEGDLAEVFLLSDVISQRDVFDLATGRITPRQLICSNDAREFYFPLDGDSPERELWRGRDGVLTGTVPTFHPPTNVLPINRFFLPAGAEGPSTAVRTHRVLQSDFNRG